MSMVARGGYFSDGGFIFKWGAGCPMGEASVLMGGFSKKLLEGGRGAPHAPPPPRLWEILSRGKTHKKMGQIGLRIRFFAIFPSLVH